MREVKGFKVIKLTADFRDGKKVTRPIVETVKSGMQACTAHELCSKLNHEQDCKLPIEDLFINYGVKPE